ncbi:hypothetical protein MHBO_003033 [Bonamia ostreae]|uniref:Uncharacterized protein n=1 Tax=Bonamia ostreae TaxID=126728 RepID=A0ABV2APX5_9EUKA
MEKAKLLSLKTMATVMKNDDGVFSLRTVKNGGLVLFGVDNLAEKYANVKFSIDVGASSNLLPTLDSWSKETTCSFTMDKEDLKTTALVGSFIRANNEKCSFSAKVNYSAIDN